MCGITGIFAFNLVGKFNKIHVTQATQRMSRRGPDFQDIYLDEWVALGHRRLSVIDTSTASNQPMWDETHRYGIVFNGEIFNYRELRHELIAKGVSFATTGDTEVLLKLYIHEGEKCLTRLNGFFSFAVYDKAAQSLFVARDRYGIKPLLYVFDEDKFIFASEMKSIVEYGIDRTIDYDALLAFLQLNYIPAPATIFSAVRKVLPGHYLTIHRGRIAEHKWYELPGATVEPTAIPSYEEAAKTLRRKLEEAVRQRLVADVPLGCFLSGGIDSSIIAGLARQSKPDLQTYSIGFKDEKFFDETPYARLVARHFGTQHSVFMLSNEDLLDHLEPMLKQVDEPFADSSALAVYIISRETRRHATVALSGDGADEILGGYHKHRAFARLLNPGWREALIRSLGPAWVALPKSRNNPVGNLFRQFHRFSRAAGKPLADAYWDWAGFASESEARALLATDKRAFPGDGYSRMKALYLGHLAPGSGLNAVLRTDLNLVLPNDMLTKVDLMSMAHGLEVRVPFLDHHVVEFAFGLPPAFKTTPSGGKRILKDAFRDFLPAELYTRPKKGFEIPLLRWLRNELGARLRDALSQEFIVSQGIFEYEAVARLLAQLRSGDPGDAPARLWGLLIFQNWWRRYGKGA